MSYRRKYHSQKVSGNCSSVPKASRIRNTGVQNRSIHRTPHPGGISRQSFAPQKTQNPYITSTTGHPHPIIQEGAATGNRRLAPIPSAKFSLPNPPTSLVGFESANQVHQRRLELNTSQSRSVYNFLKSTQENLNAHVTNPPTSTASWRAYVLSKMNGYCKRYCVLLGIRRAMLEKQQYWLEQAIQVDEIRNSATFLTAIDMQIQATKNLVACQKLPGLSLELVEIGK